jgi:hypothetical protein
MSDNGKEFDFTKFVDFLSKEEEQKKKKDIEEQLTDNRKRFEKTRDIKYQNIKWK